MHFATFAGGEGEAVEPLVRLAEAKARMAEHAASGVSEASGARDGDIVGEWWEEGGFGVVDVGAGGLVRLQES